MMAKNIRTGKCAAAAMACVMLFVGLASSSLFAEPLRTFYRGKWIHYELRGDLAVVQGDIVIGSAALAKHWAEQAQRVDSAGGSTQKALTIDQASDLWPRGSSGIVEVPYTIENGDAMRINEAIRQFNELFAGIIQWVPRAQQADFVAFDLKDKEARSCFSNVGRIGGRQVIGGFFECSVGTLLHEMGHAIGMWHSQQDASAANFVDVKLSNFDARFRSNVLPIFDTQRFSGYDYVSTMQYSVTAFASSADPVTIRSKPAGIPLRPLVGYSLADVDAIKRLYGNTPTRTTISSNPEGLLLMVDGVEVRTPATFDWSIGSTHRIWANEGLQRTTDGFNVAFARWSHDASESPSRQLTWQVAAGDNRLGAPSNAPRATVLIANFSKLVQVNATSSVQAGGSSTVTPRSTPWPGTTDLYPQFSQFDVAARANAGFLHYLTFGNAFTFGGGLALTPSASLVVTDAFPTQLIGALFQSQSSPTIAVNVTGSGAGDAIRTTITPPGEPERNSSVPRLSRDTPGVWKYAIQSPVSIGPSVRTVIEGYDGFDTTSEASAEVAMPAFGVKNVTIRTAREVRPYTEVIPSCAGTIARIPDSEWVRTGEPLLISLATTNASQFVGWRGTVSGSALTNNTTVGGSASEFVAVFNTVNEPLTLTGSSVRVIGDDSINTAIVLKGSGFTSNTRVFIDNIAIANTSFIDSKTLRVVVNRSQFPTAGTKEVYVQNTLRVRCNVDSESIALEVLPPSNRVGRVLTEYYNSQFDYYFMTGRDGDKAALDGAAALGWGRTGSEIKVFAVPTEDTQPLERHFFAEGARGGTRGSHFFTGLGSEAVLLTGLNPTNLPLKGKPFLEGVEGYVILPKNGTCTDSTVPIYRLFKGAPRFIDDGNHRFATTQAIRQQMINLGWTDEGVVFCGTQ